MHQDFFTGSDLMKRWNLNEYELATLWNKTILEGSIKEY